MNKSNFTKLTTSEKNKTFGGNAWLLAIPLIFSSITQLVGSIRAFTSKGSGSIKSSATGAVETHWSDEKTPSASTSHKSSSSSSASQESHPVFYAY